MNTLIALMLVFPSALIMAIAAATPITLIQISDEYQERKRQKNKIKMMIKVYAKLADEEVEAEKKAYWLAKLYNYQWALRQMEGVKK